MRVQFFLRALGECLAVFRIEEDTSFNPLLVMAFYSEYGSQLARYGMYD